MKRLCLYFLISLLVAGVNISPAHAQSEEIQIQIDGLPVEFDVPPQLEQGRLLVPFRAIAEALNVTVSWDEANRLITAKNDYTLIKMTVGDSTALINEKDTFLDVPPNIYSGRVLVPVRFLSEALGCQVQWDGDNRVVSIVSPMKAMSVMGFYALGDENTSSWTDLFGTPYPQTEYGNTGVVSDISLGWYSIDEEGRLLTDDPSGWRRPQGWEEVLDAAEDYKLNTQMIVFATDANGKLNRLLNDETAVDNAVKDIVKEARYYQGVNLDFEGLGWNDNAEQLSDIQTAYNNFVQKLAQELHKENQELFLTLHAPNSSYTGYDYKTLGNLADHIIVMAYDYGSKPEPNNLVLQAVDMALTTIPADKLWLGISVNNETGTSLTSKIGIAKRYNLEGIAVWRLGLVTDDMWTTIWNNIKKK